MHRRLLNSNLLSVVVGLLATATARADEIRLKLSESPAAVQQTFVAEAKGAHLETIIKSTDDDVTVYAARVAIGGKHYEITVEADGTLIDKTMDEEIVESEVAFANAPAAVQKTMREEAEGDEIDTLNQTSQGDKAFYETGVTIGGKDYWLMVDSRGRLLEKRLGFEIEEDSIDFDEAPAAVQQTLKRVAKGAEIDGLHKTTENAKSEFDAQIKIDGRDYVVRVGDDGTLIEKAFSAQPEEEELELSEVPQAVQRTLRDEARGADIEAVIKKTQDDESLYGIAVVLGGNSYWIIVGADGLLVSKELDD
ncbi:MAG TPA: hypothetical protein VIK18_02805 [Pirellulales bacterium]